MISNILLIFQIITAVLLVITILLQQRGQGLGSAFGGDNMSFHTKRGLEKTLFILTIILGIIFIATTIVTLII